MDSISQPHYMTRRIAELGQKGMVISDHGNMNGFSEIQKAGKKNSVVVLPGIEFYVAIRGHKDKSERDTAHLTVWAQNIEGYRNLCRLQTKSFVDGYYYDPRTDFDMLAEHSEGLMAASGCLGGVLNKPLSAGDRTEAERRIKILSQIFDGRFWMEIQNHEIEEEIANHAALKQIAKKFSLPIVAAHDSHYSDVDDYIPHDVVICLRTNSKVGDTTRKMAYKPKEFHLKSADEMLERHEPAHVWESGRIFDMCEAVDITTKTFHIPNPVESPKEHLYSLIKAGAAKRYGKLTAKIKERIRYEYDTICKAGFAPYLLIIQDIYDYARKQNIPLGAGRGSAAGSVVCYCIGITNIDPFKYDLMFERFLDPNRVSQPDIDADFSALRRQEIIDYIKGKYGEDCVSQIVTFQTMGGRAAIRDCARALNHSLELSDKLAKMIPQEGSVTRDREEREYIQQALDTVKEFKAEYDRSPDAKEIVDMAISLEGILKATSLHAAGVVISDKPLGEYCPMITVANDKKRLLATGYGMNELEDIGLLKVDVLGIRYLDVLDDAIRFAKRDGILPADFTADSIDVNDRSIYDLLSAGNTAGVFQCESAGMTKLIRSLNPDSFDDIATCISIFRPGPMSQIPNLIKRKHGEEEISYPHPSLEPVLKGTYGLIILQEQIIRMGQIIAGYSLTRADQLRKVIAKKVVEKMPSEKADFINGAIAQGHKGSWAQELFERVIEPAAKYAFGKSHAYAYSDLTAKTAWCKANIPVHYFSALLKSIEDHPNRDEKMTQYIADARSMGVAVLPPDIHESEFSFTALPAQKAVRFGLNGIKHVGSKAVTEIIKERKRGSFEDLFSCVQRVKSTLVNSRCLQSLVASGALDSLPGTRADKLASLPIAMERADMLREDRKRIAAGGKPVKRKNPIPEPVLIEGYEDKVELLAGERELIGFYLSGHPWLDVAQSSSASHTPQSARDAENGSYISVGGIVSRLTEHTTKKGKQKMFFGAIEDDRAVLEFVVFPHQYEAAKNVLKLDAPVVLDGKIENESEESEGSSVAKLIVQSAAPVARGIKKKKAEAPVHSHVIELPRVGYHQEILKWREFIDQSDDIVDLKFVLPDGSEVKVLK